MKHYTVNVLYSTTTNELLPTACLTNSSIVIYKSSPCFANVLSGFDNSVECLTCDVRSFHPPPHCVLLDMLIIS